MGRPHYQLDHPRVWPLHCLWLEDWWPGDQKTGLKWQNQSFCCLRPCTQTIGKKNRKAYKEWIMNTSVPQSISLKRCGAPINMQVSGSNNKMFFYLDLVQAIKKIIWQEKKDWNFQIFSHQEEEGMAFSEFSWLNMCETQERFNIYIYFFLFE